MNYHAGRKVALLVSCQTSFKIKTVNYIYGLYGRPTWVNPKKTLDPTIILLYLLNRENVLLVITW